MSTNRVKLAEKIFPLGIPLAWRQLTSERKRFLAAVAGIAFAVTMMLFQLGLYDALFVTVIRPHSAMNADLMMVSKSYAALPESGRFTRRRLYQVTGDEAVASVASVYIGAVAWKNPETMGVRKILMIGCRGGEQAFRFPGLEAKEDVLKAPDQVLFDIYSRKDYGPIARLVETNGVAETEAEGLRVRVTGLFQMGTTFVADGNLLVGEGAFFRLTPDFPKELICVGLIRLKPGENPDQAATRLQDRIPNDVKVVTRQQFFAIEHAYWAERTPIGFVITASMVVGMIVGGVIIYQILYADVSDHLHEYATLKGIGFSDRFFLGLIVQQAIMLSLCGFFPGAVLAAGLFKLTKVMAYLPTELRFDRLVIVFFLATAMCGIGGVLAARKLRSANAADLF